MRIELVSFLAMISYLTYLLVFAYLNLKNSRYSIIKNTESNYVTVKKLLILFGCVGILGPFFIMLIFLKISMIPKIIIIFFIVMIILRIVMMVFNMILENDKNAINSKAYYIFGILNFVTTYTIISRCTDDFLKITEFDKIIIILSAISSISIISLTLLFVTMLKPFRIINTLCERVFIISEFLWFFCISTYFLLL